MREEDKVLLLAEIMGIDTRAYVSKYVEELRSSDIFLKLCENVSYARKVRSYKAQRLIDDFELINFDSIDSLQSLFKVDALINHLLANSEAKDYINPFFYYDDEDIVNVGQISLHFDYQNFSLDDIVLDERYTFKYKIDYIKESYLSWRKEVKEMVINPLTDAYINIDKFPEKELFSFRYRISLLFIIFANVFFFIAPIISPDYLLLIYNGTMNVLAVNIIYNIMFVLLFIVNIYLIITINDRLAKTKKYRETRKMIKNTKVVLDKIDKKCESFYKYVLNNLTEGKPLSKKIKTFAIDDKYLMSLSFLLKEVEYGTIETEDDIEIHDLIILAITLFILASITLVVIYFLIQGGVIDGN